MPGPLTLKIDLSTFLEATRFVSDSVLGHALPLVTRVHAIEDRVPLARDLVAALGTVLDRLEDEKQEPFDRDARMTNEVLTHLLHVSRLEGAISALIAVGEELQRSEEKKTRRKKG